MLGFLEGHHHFGCRCVDRRLTLSHLVFQIFRLPVFWWQIYFSQIPGGPVRFFSDDPAIDCNLRLTVDKGGGELVHLWGHEDCAALKDAGVSFTSLDDERIYVTGCLRLARGAALKRSSRCRVIMLYWRRVLPGWPIIGDYIWWPEKVA